MKQNFKKIMTVLAALFVVCGSFPFVFANSNVKAVTPNVPVQFLGINDFHGAIEQAKYLAPHLDKATASFLSNNPGTDESNSLRVQAGDLVGATPAISGLLRDQPAIKVINQMNFKVGTLGNHEFDKGLPEYLRLISGQTTDAYGDVVKNYPVEPLNMDIVIANVIEKESGNIPQGFAPYTIKEVGGEKVGFIGVVTTDVPNLVLAENTQKYNVLDEAQTIVKYAKQLRQDGVNAIVVLGHCGFDDAKNIVKKINELDSANSVDIFFGGHVHSNNSGVEGNTAIVVARNGARNYSEVVGEIDPTTHDFVNTPAPKYAAVDNTLGESDSINEIILDANNRVAPVLNEEIGVSTTEVISRDIDENRESALGNLITDAQRHMANVSGFNVDFAFTNNGGIRADLGTEKSSDNKNIITWGKAYTTQPFGNIMQIVELTGSDIVKALKQQNSYFLQVSGLTYFTTAGNDMTETVELVVLLPDGTPIDLDATYRAVINDFIFGGGDGFSAFKNAKLVGVMEPDTDTLVNYIKLLSSKGEKISASIEGRKIQSLSQEEFTARKNEVLNKQNQKEADRVNKLILSLPLVDRINFTNAELIGYVKAEFNKLTSDQVALLPEESIARLDNAIKQLEKVLADDKSPEVFGVENNGTYFDKVTITYSDNVGVMKALINGKPFYNKDTFSDVGDYKIEVTDLNGNKTEIAFKIVAKDATDNPPPQKNDPPAKNPSTGQQGPGNNVFIVMLVGALLLFLLVIFTRSRSKSGK